MEAFEFEAAAVRARCAAGAAVRYELTQRLIRVPQATMGGLMARSHGMAGSH
jgi:hypothetical protein